MRQRIGRGLLVAVVATVASTVSAQVPFPGNWLNAPQGRAAVNVYPYAGQCWTIAPIGDLPMCQVSSPNQPGYAPSFKCDGNGFPNQTASAKGNCGQVSAPPKYPFTLLTGNTQRDNKYKWPLLNPLDYEADKAKYSGADYYEVGVHEAWGFDGIAKATLFPNPGFTVPNGYQWTGLKDASGKALLTPIWGVGQINMGGGPVTKTLQSLNLFPKTGFVPSSWSANNYVATWPSISIRGQYGRPVVVKWINEFPNNHLFCPHPEAADWPCAIDRTFMGVKASIDPQKAPPTFQLAGVKTDGVNQYGSPMQPDNSWVTHLHGGEIPPATDGFAEKWFGNRVTGALYSPVAWPLDPTFFAPENSLVTQKVGLNQSNLFRPGGSAASNAFSSYYYDTYTYPMVNRESTIWFHDHTLGKTHHNVVAGPAGFFPVIEKGKHYPVVNGTCTAPTAVKNCPYKEGCSCEYSWIDPVTEPRNSLGVPLFDLFLAIQDRDFNGDGTINFPNGLGNVPAYGYANQPGNENFVPGTNPQVHPAWVPEYFATNALVNGVLWPAAAVEAGFYRLRLVDGSDARCYTLGFSKQDPWRANAAGVATVKTPIPPVPGDLLTDGDLLPFTIVANEQGYLYKGVKTKTVTMCPGERYEFILDFSGLTNQKIFMVNSAHAPYPGDPADGTDPFAPGSRYADMATIMRFDVGAAVTTNCTLPNTAPAVVPACPVGGSCPTPPPPPRACTVLSLVIPDVIDADFDDLTGNSILEAKPIDACPKDPTTGKFTVDPTTTRCIAAQRYLYLNERIDAATGASLGLQINGVPFEYDVTETPLEHTYEQWNIVNLTVDAHPMHPHLGKFQILNRTPFDPQAYRRAICWNQDPGSNDCTPGPAQGGMKGLVPDPNQPDPLTGFPIITGPPSPPESTEVGWKDAMRAQPGYITSFIGKWEGNWKPSTLTNSADVTAPGAGNPNCYAAWTCQQQVQPGQVQTQCQNQSAVTSKCGTGNAANWVYPSVTTGPYVWHCHINSHEDSEMMRTSLVVK